MANEDLYELALLTREELIARLRAAETAVKIADRLLVERADIIDELRGALQWMSGSTDFAPGGQAHEGWLRVRHLAHPEQETV